MNIDHDSVCALIEQTAEAEILPLWQNLQDHQVEFKHKGDVVTAADRACESVLSKQLQKLLPGSLVIGEEGAHLDPSLFAALQSVRPVWVIDPLDGTSNFAAGSGPIAVMVCLVQHGVTLASWIYDPVEHTMLRAEQNCGAWLGDTRLRVGAFQGPPAQINGALSTKYLPPALRPAAESGALGLGVTRASGCAGYDYRALACGQYQFLFYYRTLVWDHAPGVLIAREAGALADRYNERPYTPVNQDAVGLLCATDRSTWRTVQKAVIPSSILA